MRRVSPTRSVVLLGFLVGVGLLSLADRAPGAAQRGLRRGRALGSAIEDRIGIDWVDRSDVPFAWDTAGHFVLWATAAFLARSVLGQRVRVWLIAASLFVASAAVEVAQGQWSATRSPELSDLVANGVGVVVGVVLAVSTMATRRFFGRLSRSSPRPA